MMGKEEQEEVEHDDEESSRRARLRAAREQRKLEAKPATKSPVREPPRHK